MRSFTIICLVLIIAVYVMATPNDNREKRSPDDEDEQSNRGVGSRTAGEMSNGNAAKGLETSDAAREGKGKGKGKGKFKGKGRGRKEKSNDEVDEFVGSPFAVISDSFVE